MSQNDLKKLNFYKIIDSLLKIWYTNKVIVKPQKGGLKMKKLLVVDGNSIINRAFYGVRPLTASDGP